ncbi:hypothetical protein DXG01_004842 [Tephrocybe rancida]|nr:hypothetical protein DXG01_004842 [Tephrocybe rancida]
MICKPAIQMAFLLNIFAIIIIQGILVIRIWYLFQANKVARIGIIVGFVISVVLSLVFLYLSVNPLVIIPQAEIAHAFPGIRNEGFLHTAMYIMTGVRALRNRRLLKHAPVLKRLLRDKRNLQAGLLPLNPYASFLLTTTSIAVSRVMFSIHSLAHRLGSDSAWLLSNVELSRVGWRKGAHEGELIVESYTVYDDVESDDVESVRSDVMSKMSMRETRVGVYSEDEW